MLPIFFVFAVGYAAQSLLKLNTAMISKLAIYILVPFLVFRTFYSQTIDSSFMYFTIFLLGLCCLSISIITLFTKILRYSEGERCGLILSSAFMNNGNYGTPLVLFLFGSEGMKVAIVLMVLQQLLMSTIGVYYAAKGSPYNVGGIHAAGQILRMPMIYGAILGILCNWMSIPLGSLMKGIDFIADAAIPVIMIALGMQLANMTVKKVNWKILSFSIFMRLMLSPVLAFLLVAQLPLDNLTKQIMVIIAATPTAANTTMYAIQFRVQENNVSAATLMSTVLSLVTVPAVIYLTR
ncbi:AEC family transporter [Oceanobacillus sp. CFH 90083]|uniref:AEC family transporter n=1 Tax=Oceanobacillus sp. CFH 90083 TaxID=2592336 RepID=UPI001D139B18|nr:AEC family transporter [Oceanobacillus sp. CFH 90083]